MHRGTDTLPSRLFGHARRIGNHTAQHFHDAGQWYPVGWGTYARLVSDLAAGLIDLGLRPGDRVAILSETRREWSYADLAIMSAGGVSVGVFPSLGLGAIADVLERVGARFCMVDTPARLDVVAGVADRVPTLERVVVFDAAPGSVAAEPVISLDALRRRGRAANVDIAARVRGIEPSQAATFVVTSGTTGPPKAAMITHGAIATAVRARAALGLGPEDLCFSMLPLASALPRSVEYTCIWNAVPVAYGRGLLSLGDDLETTNPTFMAAVPRLFERLYAGFARFADSGAPAERLALAWAQRIGREVSNAAREGRRLPAAMAVQAQLARSLVFESVRAMLGGRMRLVITSGGQMPAEIVELFDAAGLAILEGWGMTETFSIGTSNLPDERRLGTVGRALPGVEVRIADDGELLIRGESLFAGYFRDDASTVSAFDIDGYFRTGDLASLDEHGCYVVHGRLADQIRTATGTEVSPEEIERLIRADPRISQVIVFGDQRDYLTALVSVHDIIRAEMSESQLTAMVEEILATKNLQLDRAEQIRRFRILPHDLSEASGELSPTLEVRRAVVAEKFGYLVEEMYLER